MFKCLPLAVLLLPIATLGQSTDLVKLCSEPLFGGVCIRVPALCAGDSTSCAQLSMALGSLELKEGQALSIRPCSATGTDMLLFTGPTTEADLRSSVAELWPGMPNEEPLCITLQLTR